MWKAFFADGRYHSGSLVNSQAVILSEVQTEYLPGASGVFWWERLIIWGYCMQVVAWCETKSCKNGSVGFCSGLNWSKEITFHYVSVLVSARFWVEIRWISSQDLSFSRGTWFPLLLVGKWPGWTSYLRFDSGRNLSHAWWSIKFYKVPAFAKKNLHTCISVIIYYPKYDWK